MTVSQDFRRLLSDFLVTTIVLAGIATVIWTLPDLRPDFVPDVQSWAILTLCASVLVTFLTRLIRTDWFGTVYGRSRLGRGSLIFLLCYVLGIALLENFGIAPPFETWRVSDRDFVSFLAIYSTIAVLFAFLITWILVVFKAGVDGEAKQFAILRSFLPVAVLLVYCAGIFLAEWLGLAPRIYFENLLTLEFARFLILYTAILILAGVTLYLWRTNPAMVSRREARRRELQEERDRFGSMIALLLRLAPWFTFVAQVVSFITSFLGLRLILSQLESDNELLSFMLPLPQWLVLWLDLETPSLSLALNNDMLAALASFLMSGVIWYFSAFAVGQIRAGQRVSPLFFVLTIIFGLLSTYTAFLMWNGESAVAGEMRNSIRNTEDVALQTEEIDEKYLVEPLRDLSLWHGSLSAQRAGLQHRALTDGMKDLYNKIGEESARFTAANNVSPLIAASLFAYSNARDCEIEIGCLSGYSGDGPVAKELTEHIYTLETNTKVWASLVQTRDVTLGKLREATESAQEALGARDLRTAEKHLIEVRRFLIEVSSQNPRPIIDSLVARLRVPIDRDLGTIGQTEAIAQLKQRISTDLAQMAIIAADISSTPLVPPPIRQIDTVGLEFLPDVSALDTVIGAMSFLIGERATERQSIRGTLDKINQRIQVAVADDTIFVKRPTLIADINRQRDEASLLTALNVDALRVQVSTIGYAKSAEVEPFPDSVPLGETLKPLIPRPLHILVLEYAYLAIIPLLIQLLLDFGYTIAIMLGVTQIRGREPLAG